MKKKLVVLLGLLLLISLSFAKGKLYLDSGVNFIYLNESYVGSGSQLLDLDPNDYSIKIKDKKGKLLYSELVKVREGETTRLDVDLNPDEAVIIPDKIVDKEVKKEESSVKQIYFIIPVNFLIHNTYSEAMFVNCGAGLKFRTSIFDLLLSYNKNLYKAKQYFLDEDNLCAQINIPFSNNWYGAVGYVNYLTYTNSFFRFALGMSINESCNIELGYNLNTIRPDNDSRFSFGAVFSL